MLLHPLPPKFGDIAVLLARVLLGVVLIAHGWQKWFKSGLGGTTRQFATIGVPLPPVSAFYAATVELVGGALLILGAFTAIVSILVVLDMAGAALLVHVQNGILITKASTGWELVGMIGAAGLALAAYGAGRYSVDHLIAARRAGIGTSTHPAPA